VLRCKLHSIGYLVFDLRFYTLLLRLQVFDTNPIKYYEHILKAVILFVLKEGPLIEMVMCKDYYDIAIS